MKIHDPVLRRNWSRKRQRGLTLIESAIVLAVAAISLVFFTRMMSENAEQVRAKGVSEKMVEVHEAARSYLKTYNAALMTAAAGSSVVVIPAGKADATGAVPSGPNASLPSLQGGGFLSQTYVDRNGYGQRHALLVRRVTVPATGEARLDAIVTTFSGTRVPDRQLGRIAGYLGAAGGYVPVLSNAAAGVNTATVYGSYGGWRTPTANWSAAGSSAPSSGAVVSTLAFEDSRLVADFLYRNDIGIPEANRMNTSIDLNANNLNNVTTIAGANGRLAVSGRLDGSADISAQGNISSNATVTGVNVWASQDVAAARNLHAGQDIASGRDISAVRNIAAGDTLWAGQTIGTPGNINAGQNLTVGGLATIPNIQGNTRVHGDLAANRLNADTLIFDSTGRWGGNLRLADLLPKQVGQASYSVVHGSTLAKPSCPGGQAKLLLYRKQDSTRTRTDWSPPFVDVVDSIDAYDYGSYWQVIWTGQEAVPGYARTGVAQTFCFYG